MVNKYLYRRGGSEAYMFNLAEMLLREGNHVNYFGLSDKRNDVPDDGLSIKGRDIAEYNFLDKLRAPVHLIYSSNARKLFSKSVRRYNPDIIHINNFNFQITPSILFEAKKLGKKVVLTVHDPQLVCPNHRLYIPSKNTVCEDCRGGKFYKCLVNRCFDGSLSKSVVGAIESTLYRRLDVYRKYVDLIISPSYFLKNKLEELGFKHPNIKIIPNFVSSPKKDITSNKDAYILYFGRISIEKGLPTLIKAVESLENRSISLKIVGDGPMKLEIMDYLKTKSSDRIEYIGFKTGNELDTLIEKAKMSIYPSEWYENCPLSIIESFSLGTPVIGSNLGGIPELIDDGINGFVYKPGDHLQLAEKIQDLFYDDTKISLFSKNASQKYLSNYTGEQYYKKLMEEYKNLINENV